MSDQNTPNEGNKSNEAPVSLPPELEPNMGNQGDISSDDKLWVLLTYIFTPLIPIVLLLLEDKKDRPFIKAHNVQALIWGIIVIVLTTISAPICGILGWISWALAIYWGIKGYRGEYVTIPVLTDFVKKQGWA